MAEDKRPLKTGVTRTEDRESDLLIYQGATISQLCAIWGMDSRDLKRKFIGRVAPVGKKGIHDLYSIKEVAPYLSPPAYDIDEFISKMNAVHDLPVFIRKEFWIAMNQRLTFEQKQGDLWPTKDVVEAVGELLKTVKMTMLMTRESVSRRTDVTKEQRIIINGIIDSCLEEIHSAASKRFAEYKPSSQETDTPEIEAEL